MLLIRNYGVVAVFVILAGLLGCSGDGTTPVAKPGPMTPGFDLAAPADLTRQVSAVGSPLFRRGQEHVLDAVHGTMPGAEDDLVFSPSWDSANPNPAAMSYAVYNFALDGYAGPAEISSSWDLEPDTVGWVGISNFDLNTWDWYEFPSTGFLGFDPVVSVDASDVLLVAYVILDDTDYTLRWTRVGPDLAPEASILADVQSGLTPLAVEFDAQFSEDFEGDIIKYEFDPEGDGTFVDHGTNPTYNHSYTEAGGFQAAVRVTDSSMNTSIAQVRIGACWKHSWGGPDYDSGRFTAVDDDGNTYVLGLTTGFGQGDNELLILKYDPFGSIIWQKTMGNGSGDDPGGMVLDPAGNIYICGSDLDPGDFDYSPFIFSLGSDGTLRWQVSWPTAGSTEAMGLALGNDGSVYMACYHSEPFPAESDVLLIKYSALDGTQQWARTWGTVQRDRPMDIESDPWGNVYLLCMTNSFSVLNALTNTAIVGFDSDGSLFLETVYGLDTETEASALSYANGVLYVLTGGYVAAISDSGVLGWQASFTHATDDLAGYDVVGIQGVGCFMTLGISPGMLDTGLIGLDETGSLFYQKAFRLNTAHQVVGGFSLLPDTGLMLTGRSDDNTGTWEDYSVTVSTPTLTMSPVSGTVTDVATMSIGSGYVLGDVPLGSITIDSGGGNTDLVIQRFYPFEPSSW